MTGSLYGPGGNLAGFRVDSGHVQQHSKDDKQDGDDHSQTILKSARLLEQYL